MTIRILNFTPFANLRYAGMDNEGDEFGVFMAKAAYDILKDGSCKLSDEQEPINFTDRYHGELNVSSLRHPSEFVPYKPSTDIIVDAIAYAPERKPARSWIAGVEVRDRSGVRAVQTVRVMGPRWWIPKWKRDLTNDEKREWKRYRDLFIGWELTEPEPILFLPLRYEYAYGGVISKGKNADGTVIREAFDYNSVGIGIIDPEWTDHTMPQPAPQIEFSEEPITDPYKAYYPAGLGPIPPVWKPRRPLGGTYDKAWIDTVWPKWPKDYDFAYHNCSMPGLISKNGHIDGDFFIKFLNLDPACKDTLWPVRLTDPLPFISVRTEAGDWRHFRMALDTVHCDIGEEAGADRRLFLTWRIVFPLFGVEEIQLYKAEDDYKNVMTAFRKMLFDAEAPLAVKLAAREED